MGGGGSITKKHNYQHIIVNPGGQQSTEFPITVTVNKCGRNVLKITNVSPCLTARDYKGYAGKKDMIAVIEERKEQDNEQRE